MRRLRLEFAVLAALCLIAGCGGTTTASTVTIGPTTQATPANAPSAARPLRPSPARRAPHPREREPRRPRAPLKRSTEPSHAGQYLERIERLERTNKFPLEKKRLGELAARLRASGITPPKASRTRGCAAGATRSASRRAVRPAEQAWVLRHAPITYPQDRDSCLGRREPRCRLEHQDARAVPAWLHPAGLSMPAIPWYAPSVPARCGGNSTSG